MDSKSESMEDRTFASEHSESDEAPDSQDCMRIVLLGVSGAGKTAIANAILGRVTFKESRTRESEKQTGRVDDRNISIIDTPGFFNTQLTDEELQEQMMKSLYLSFPGPHVFLLVINLGTFREEQRNLARQIQDKFGEEALLFTMVLFIGQEKISKTEQIQIAESENMKKMLSYFEGRFHVINCKTQCGPNQIIELLKSIDELVKNNGGQNYSIEIYLKNQTKLREQKERMEEDEKKRQEVRDAQEQREINPEDDIKAKGLKPKALAIARKMEEENRLADQRIVLVGKTGSGKSSTGNTILGSFEFEQDISFKSVTTQCQRRITTVEDRKISVIDTPGLCDTSMSPEDLKAEIVKCVELSVPGPHAFLLVIRLDVRFTDEEKNTVKWIQENFGEGAAHYTIILFTHADALKGKSLDEYIKANPDQQALIDSCSGRYHSFNNEDLTNRSQVTKLLEKIKKMVEKNGGKHYTSEIYKKAQEKIKWEAWKKNMKNYGTTALTYIGGGTVVVAAGAGVVAAVGTVVEAAGGPGAVATNVAKAAVAQAIKKLKFVLKLS